MLFHGVIAVFNQLRAEQDKTSQGDGEIGVEYKDYMRESKVKEDDIQVCISGLMYSYEHAHMCV